MLASESVDGLRPKDHFIAAFVQAGVYPLDRDSCFRGDAREFEAGRAA
jgi:hypothetical protein